MSEAIALSSPAVAGGHRRDDRLVAIWLLAVAAMIFVMVVIGGITRLTESGLSITEWKPVSGVIPPLDAAAWQQEFDLYKQIPEFQKLRPDMTLAEFKGIFWWEYVHRLWGRLIGVAFALPRPLAAVARPHPARACARAWPASSSWAGCRGRSAGSWWRAGSRSAPTSASTGWSPICSSPC